MAEASVNVVLVPGNPRFGLWCDRCRLPSRIEIDVWWPRPDGLQLVCTGSTCTNESQGDGQEGDDGPLP